MIKDNSKIVEEYSFKVKEYPFEIRARIRESRVDRTNKFYVGTISHYWKPTEQAMSAYRPSLSSHSKAEVKKMIKAYVSNFKPIGLVVNEYF